MPEMDARIAWNDQSSRPGPSVSTSQRTSLTALRRVRTGRERSIPVRASAVLHKRQSHPEEQKWGWASTGSLYRWNIRNFGWVEVLSSSKASSPQIHPPYLSPDPFTALQARVGALFLVMRARN